MAVSMLWYLLSPIRGTTRPPRLSATHPIRRAFYRHGKTTAQHWLVAMLFSVAIAMACSYPTVFLADNPTAGLTAYPPHFWTTAKVIDDSATAADVEMRQIWVHGSYMKALEKNVLRSGLAIQQSLIGSVDASNVDTTANDTLDWSTWQWGYHSPLMYWNSSAQAIDVDDDLVKTINEQKHIASSLNIVLRPASVFAGKRFDGQYLQAADALVISLINKVGGDRGQLWASRMRSLASEACEGCTLFPSDGHPSRRQVFEFGFTPLSLHEHMALTLAYSCMAVYVLLSLGRIQAFHSRFGLVVTAITQMTCSILASITICNMLKINLSMIPQNAYPFTVLVIGLENMFRLINGVLAYPPTMATDLRIANALGDVGPLSMATAAQNLIILYVLSTLVSPGVAAFCAFAAIATLFDVFFLLTFFVAVLNVDIRRLELQDALAVRQSQYKNRRRPSPSRHPWFEALIQGKLPFSTRMAGTAVTTTFILSLNYHVFEQKAKAMGLRHLISSLLGQSANRATLDTFKQQPMNATLTADEWMRMQDIDTAREVLQLAKPGADTFVIRIYEPLVVVLSGSDRTEALQYGEQWMQALRTFAVHHFYPVAIAVIFIVAFVAILMNFLLYNEAGDVENQVDLEEPEESLTVHTIGLPHKLDVVKLACNESGHVVSVALDRTIAIAIADRIQQTYKVVSIPTMTLNEISWPVRNLAIDESGEWLACHGVDDNILVYNYSNGTLVSNLLKFPDDNPALVFEFVSLPSLTGMKLHLLVLTSGGRIAFTSVDQPTADYIELTQTPLVGAAFLNTSGSTRRLIVVTETARILSFSWTDGSWNLSASSTLKLGTSTDRLVGRVHIEIFSELETGLLAITTPNATIFLDSNSLVYYANLELKDMATMGLAADRVLIGPDRKCSFCGGIGWRTVAVSRETVSKKLHECTTWTVQGEGEDACICLSQSSPSCLSTSAQRTDSREIGAPGAWCTVKSHAIFGIRKLSPHHIDGRPTKGTAPSSALRHRRRARQSTQAALHADQWEAYKLSVDGQMMTTNAIATDVDFPLDIDNKDLYVNTAGPAVPLDAQAAAVAFGNTIKIVRASRGV